MPARLCACETAMTFCLNNLSPHRLIIFTLCNQIKKDLPALLEEVKEKLRPTIEVRSDEEA